MDDIIKRQDAIDAIETTIWYHQNENLEMASGANSTEHQAWYKAEDIFDALNNVPSIDDLSSVAQDIAQIIINALDMRRWLERSGSDRGEEMAKRLKDTKYRDNLPKHWLLAEEIEEAVEKNEIPIIVYEDWNLIAKCLKEYGQMPDKSGTFYV